jgi:predicted PurR-regulated permease PerM
MLERNEIACMTPCSSTRLRQHQSRPQPLLAGATLAISPLLVLFAVFFWSFLWEIPGAFIGVPATIAMLTMYAQYAGSRWLAVLLSDSASRK